MENVAMILKFHTPAYPLRCYVKSMIYYRDYDAPMAYEKLLPDGQSQLVIPLDEGARRLKEGRRRSDLGLRGAWFTGVQTTPITYVGEKAATTLSIQFEAGGLWSLAGVSAWEFKDDVIAADLVLGNSMSLLREQLAACATAEAIFACADQFLMAHMNVGVDAGRVLPFVQRLLCDEQKRLGEVSECVGYSAKHLIALFKRRVGVSPKQYQRLYRFNRALALLAQAEQPDYADIALTCAFYDQAHFNREFRHFAGYTPTQYLACKRPYPHVIPLNN